MTRFRRVPAAEAARLLAEGRAVFVTIRPEAMTTRGWPWAESQTRHVRLMGSAEGVEPPDDLADGSFFARPPRGVRSEIFADEIEAYYVRKDSHP